MQNALPTLTDRLFSKAGDMADGLASHQNSIGIMHNTEGIIRSSLDSARAADNAYQTAKTTKLIATSAQDLADAKGQEFMVTTRDVLKRVLGTSWSQAWEQTGFSGQSLGIPRNLPQRLELLKSLEIYLAAHPEQEVGSLNLTQAQAATLHAALSGSRSAINVARSDSKQKQVARDEAVAELRKRMIGLVDELTLLMAADDARWLEFGLNLPEAKQTPEAPVNVVVRGGRTGHLVANWTNSARAERYRLYKQVVGLDAEFVPAATVNDTDADLNTFTPGVTVRVKITALNSAGESHASAVVETIAS